jgi:tetratricopeptide (TPR) repeat protein
LTLGLTPLSIYFVTKIEYIYIKIVNLLRCESMSEKYRDFIQQGNAAYLQFQSAEAVENYNKALSIDPKGSDAIYNKGLALLTLGKFNESNECFNQLLERNPKDPETWNNKGIVFHSLEKYSAAIKCFEKALSLNPNITDCWYYKGASLRAVGKKAESDQCFVKYQELIKITSRKPKSDYSQK